MFLATVCHCVTTRHSGPAYALNIWQNKFHQVAGVNRHTTQHNALLVIVTLVIACRVIID